MSQRHPLEVIEVRKPCAADWNQMTGDAVRRFCSHCNKFVHNLSELPAEQAEKLICESAGNMCVRFARDAQSGKVMTLDYAPVPKTSRRRAIVTMASILGAVMFGGACAAARVFRKPAPTQIMVMGQIACPTTFPTSAPSR